MLKAGKTYEEIRKAFRWEVPKTYNIGVDVCDRQPPAARALIYEDENGKVATYTFGDLRRLSNAFANVLQGLGVQRGERVGILLAQSPEAAIAHLGVYKMGGIAVPLFTLFGPDAIEYRLSNSDARLVVTDSKSFEKVHAIRDRLPNLAAVLITDGEGEGAANFWTLLEKTSGDFHPLATRADDPALIIYTSGTTGPPKGAVHAHRVLLGHLPGVEFPHNLFPKTGDLFWTPADWAWIGGLLDVLLPSWHHGVPVLAHRASKFDPERAFALMERHKVRNAFLPPTALKLMRQTKAPQTRHAFHLRSVGSGGETMGEALLAWGREVFGLTINEFYGQTEVNLVLGNCTDVMPVRAGSMGRPVPGHDVAIVDEEGNPVSPGDVGQVAIRRPDPVMFLEYWRNPEATKKKFVGDWCLTGDLASQDEAGYFWYKSRDDDLITSSGYRIGPGEIEECILKHPAVALVGVIGVPDPVRTEIIKAFVVLKPASTPSEALARDIQNFVKTRLAAHEYPREIAFVPELPMTATGKIMRRKLREQG
ncbi:MAG: acyl-CoA synthetase [Alphaproteobacteria bacterium]